MYLPYRLYETLHMYSMQNNTITEGIWQKKDSLFEIRNPAKQIWHQYTEQTNNDNTQ